MEEIKQIYLQTHLHLGNQKPQNGIKCLLGQYYTIHTVIDNYLSFIFMNINKIFRNWGKMQNKLGGILATEGPRGPKLRSIDCYDNVL